MPIITACSESTEGNKKNILYPQRIDILMVETDQKGKLKIQIKYKIEIVTKKNKTGLCDGD